LRVSFSSSSSGEGYLSDLKVSLNLKKFKPEILNLFEQSASTSLSQIIMSLEEDQSGQKMQLAYRLQQVAALVENKVTDL